MLRSRYEKQDENELFFYKTNTAYLFCYKRVTKEIIEIFDKNCICFSQ